MKKALFRLESTAGGNEELALGHNAVLEATERLRRRLRPTHVEMQDVGVINEEDGREVLGEWGDGSEKVCAMSFAFVDPQDGDADDAPTSPSRAVTLAQPLGLDLDR